jgi:mannose-6-phosphate isomerase-like protein (cupin superfamily)
MKTIAILVLFGTAMTLSARSEPRGFEVWTTSQLRDIEKQLSTNNKDQIPTQELSNSGNHKLLMQQRRSDGRAEVHETQNDILVVQSGEGTIVLGGTVVDPATIRPHEIRGTSIRGGEEIKLHAGDVVHIPAGTPHQMKVEKGTQITNLLIKIDLK